jgi:hypothetical protein
MELTPAANSHLGGDWASRVGVKRIVIICFYQLLEGRLVGWWMEIDANEFF